MLQLPFHPSVILIIIIIPSYPIYFYTKSGSGDFRKLITTYAHHTQWWLTLLSKKCVQTNLYEQLMKKKTPKMFLYSTTEAEGNYTCNNAKNKIMIMSQFELFIPLPPPSPPHLHTNRHVYYLVNAGKCVHWLKMLNSCFSAVMFSMLCCVVLLCYYYYCCCCCYCGWRLELVLDFDLKRDEVWYCCNNLVSRLID